MPHRDFCPGVASKVAESGGQPRAGPKKPEKIKMKTGNELFISKIIKNIIIRIRSLKFTGGEMKFRRNSAARFFLFRLILIF